MREFFEVPFNPTYVLVLSKAGKSSIALANHALNLSA